MVKKLTAIMMVFTFLFMGTANVFAATDQPEGMQKAVKKELKDEFYDYKDSVDPKLSHFMKVEATPKAKDGKKAGEPITVYAALAEYKTVRDNIFTFNHRETVYYDATNSKILSATEVGKLENDKLMEYKNQFSHLGKKSNLGWVLTLLALLLVVPGIFMFVWGNQVYSSTRFQIKNNLYDQRHTFN